MLDVTTIGGDPLLVDVDDTFNDLEKILLHDCVEEHQIDNIQQAANRTEGLRDHMIHDPDAPVRSEDVKYILKPVHELFFGK